MAVVNITINGQKVEAQAGQTVLEAASAAGIKIPTLCNHPALEPQGSCRMCLVEIEKQRGLQPACTFPITEGMSVQTHSPRVENARRFVLELLFSERIHYCMYCSMSGSEDSTECELQSLAYQYGLTSWQYPPNTKKRWPVDASRKYFVMDHSRCILCRRCIRACDQIAANHTLGVRDRGARTMIIADTDVPFGESSCVSCGTCLQVCPTGALMDRRSAYMGHQTDVERTKTTCLGCSVGCGVEAVTRSNVLLRVESDWEAANHGLLCVHGRFETVEPVPARVTAPLVRRNGGLAEATWEEALEAVASGFRVAGAPVGLASPRLTGEELAAIRDFFMNAFHREDVALLDGGAPPIDLGPAATLADLEAADLIAIVGGDPLEGQKVLGYVVRRTAERGVRLVIVNDGPTGLDPWAASCLPLERLADLEAETIAAERPVILYGPDLNSIQYAALLGLPKARLMPLYMGANALGALRLGYKRTPAAGESLYVLAADEVPDGQALPPAKPLPAAAFTVVQAAYRTSWTDAADVVLPAPAWIERTGHIVNFEGRELPVVSALRSPQGVLSESETLARLAERIVA